jgi:catechol 2,3-dioxygenase-like lactoylglutathione lyase family enzyme
MREGLSMPNRLDHVAIFVDNLESAISFYGETVGLGQPVIKSIPELHIRCAFFDMGDEPLIELVEFSGTGELAHGDVVVALEVDDLDIALADYKVKGLRVFDQPPTENLPLRRGWVVKKFGHGTVIELCQPGEVKKFVRSTIGNAT